MTGDADLCKNGYLLGVKNISSHAHKIESWYLLEILWKLSDEHFHPNRSPPPPRKDQAVGR